MRKDLEYQNQYIDLFKDHKLTIIFQDGPSGVFVIKNPTTIINCYQIMSGPYGLAITGDLGEYSCYQNKSWKWLREATGDYLAGKMQLESYLDIECVKERLEEFDLSIRLMIEERLSYLYEGQKVPVNDVENSHLLQLIYDNLDEIPTRYDPSEVEKLNAMTITFDRLLTEKGL